MTAKEEEKETQDKETQTVEDDLETVEDDEPDPNPRAADIEKKREQGKAYYRKNIDKCRQANKLRRIKNKAELVELKKKWSEVSSWLAQSYHNDEGKGESPAVNTNQVDVVIEKPPHKRKEKTAEAKAKDRAYAKTKYYADKLGAAARQRGYRRKRAMAIAYLRKQIADAGVFFPKPDQEEEVKTPTRPDSFL